MDRLSKPHFVTANRIDFLRGARSQYRRRFSNIVMQGDSWFDYPGWRRGFWGGPNNLQEALMLTMPRGANWFDSNISMATARQVSSEALIFRFASSQHLKLDLYCLSMGGNDLFAQLEVMLRPYAKGRSSPSECFTQDKERILLRIKSYYHQVLMQRDRYMPDVPVLAHCYVSPDQRRRGFQLAVIKAGPWINNVLSLKGYPLNTGEQGSCCRGELISYLHAELSAVIYDVMFQHPATYVYSARSRNLSFKERSYWDDEIHLSPKGWKRYAKDRYLFMQEEGIALN